ncbi:MAG: SPOR domain-containing protein [Desulfovibrio sp.]|nr:SPOR domain-containing protein [Desulfovibrio sp.]
MQNIEQMFLKMVGYSQGNTHDIAHFAKVWTYGRVPGRQEGLPEEDLYRPGVVAITHDIACPLCRKKYGAPEPPALVQKPAPVAASAQAPAASPQIPAQNPAQVPGQIPGQAGQLLPGAATSPAGASQVPVPAQAAQPGPMQDYVFQVGAFRDEESVDSLRQRLEGRGLRTRMQRKGKLYVVLVLLRGDAARAEEVMRIAEELRLGKPMVRSRKPVTP